LDTPSYQQQFKFTFENLKKTKIGTTFVTNAICELP